jgi:hypothetical protein
MRLANKLAKHGFRRVFRAVVLASGLAASVLALSTPMLAAGDANQLAWAPAREDAIVVDESLIPAESALSRSLQSQRPKALSRPAPGRMPAYVAQGASESLPIISGTPLSPEGLPVPPEMYYDENGQPAFQDGVPGDARGCDPCRGGWGGWGACMWVPLCIFVPRPPLDGLELHSGVQGFTGPANRGAGGSFGFHEGFNWGIPLAGFFATQWGANWTQNNFDGTFLSADSRHQTFATGGLYRRVDWGFQGGVVVDYLHDEWDYSADLLQLRGELSYLWCGRNELGFWFTAGLNDSENLAMRQPVDAGASLRVIDTTTTLEVNDIYAFFFRRQFACGGQGRLFGGFTSNSQGLVGGDAMLPLNPCWSLRSSFIFAAADGNDTTVDPGFGGESWNVSISLVWTPFARGGNGPNYCRPLFNVADNGSFLTRLP